ncbi:hypothetical protein BTH70_02015 [Lactobacillus delbrueckii subsp. bulgaricus]|nr:hypothetical protein [Lactobacillus delbrueckii subsp. bulgaricus]
MISLIKDIGGDSPFLFIEKNMLNKEIVIISSKSDKIRLYVDGKVKSIKSKSVARIIKGLENTLNNGLSDDLTNKVLHSLGIEVFYDTSSKNCLPAAHVYQDSIKKLIELFEKKKVVCNSSTLINVHNYVLMLSKGDCALCALRRMAYYANDIFSNKELWEIAPFPIEDQKGMIDLIRTNLITHIGEKKVAILQKNSKKVFFDTLISFSDCPICYPNYLHDTADIRLAKTSNYISNENGIRSLDNLHTIDKFHQNVGLMHPVCEDYQIDFVDRLNIPVFEARIGLNPLRYDFGFMLHGGKGRTKLQAECSALGEALERYNAQFCANEKIISGSYNQLRTQYNCIKPEGISRDSKISLDRIIDWNSVLCLTKNSQVLVPSNAIYFVYKPKDISKNFMIQDTTGLASGYSIEDAVLQGLYEVIERDAYSIYCKKQLNAYDIDLDTINDREIQELIMALDEHDISVHLKYLKTDVSAYVVHCVTEDRRREFPIYTHGSGASLDPKIAISRAITECIQLRASQLKLKEYIKLPISSEYDSYVSWGKGEKNKIGCLIRQWRSISYRTMENKGQGSIYNDISYLLSDLKRLGYNVYVANLSRLDTNVKTVRVLIPGFQPLDDSWERITSRLSELPKKLGQSSNVNWKEPIFS